MTTFLSLGLTVENNIIVSLVEVSPSTLIELKLVSRCECNKFFKTFFETFASIKMYANNVPILGAIIPDPLAKPKIRIFFEPILIFFIIVFGKVSVVIIAFAADSKSLVLESFTRGNLLMIFIASNCSPITPVEETNICSIEQLNFIAALFT